jgi:hypothetical protein
VEADEAFTLEAAEIAGDDFADGAEAVGEILMGFGHGEGGGAGGVGHFEDGCGEALADAAKGDAFDEADEVAEAGAEDAEKFEGEFGVAAAAGEEVILANEHGFAGLLGDDGGRIGAAVEDGDFGDGGGGFLHGKDDLAAAGGEFVDPDAAAGDDPDAFAGLAFVEEGLLGVEAADGGDLGKVFPFGLGENGKEINRRERLEAELAHRSIVTPVTAGMFDGGYSWAVPIKSYIAWPAPGKTAALESALLALPGCEVLPAENRDLLLLVTDTAGEAEEKALGAALEEIESLQCLSLVAGVTEKETA